VVEAQVKIAVIGNGPSANGQGKHIDACDMVVRAGQYTHAFPRNEAGKKTTAWCWPGFAKMNKYVPQGKMEHWFSVPVAWDKKKSRLTNARMMAKCRKSKLVENPMGHYLALRHALELLSERRGLFPPTTGIIAIQMAMDFQPDQLLLAGFDVTKKDTKECHYADGRVWKFGPGHDLLAEKKLLARLQDKGKWLGLEVKTKVTWIGRPSCV